VAYQGLSAVSSDFFIFILRLFMLPVSLRRQQLLQVSGLSSSKRNLSVFQSVKKKNKIAPGPAWLTSVPGSGHAI